MGATKRKTKSNKQTVDLKREVVKVVSTENCFQSKFCISCAAEVSVNTLSLLDFTAARILIFFFTKKIKKVETEG